jgi:lipopolysaccharide export system protein LptC
MTDSASPTAPFAFGPSATADNRRAFRVATRHSRRVKLLRGSMIAGSLGLVGWIGVTTLFDPFHKLPGGVTIEDTTLEGTKVTMSHPKLAGFHKDGRPYQISASSAVQDIKVPNIFELHDMDAHLTMEDKSVTHMVARAGTYDSSKDRMTLTSEVHIMSDSGLDVTARNAEVEFNSGSVVTRDPVTVAMKGDTIAADSMVISDGGKQVTFEGHVHTFLLPGGAVPQAPGATAAEATVAAPGAAQTTDP